MKDMYGHLVLETKLLFKRMNHSRKERGREREKEGRREGEDRKFLTT